MTFAKWVFRIAGVFGLLACLPMFFFETRIAPNLTHPQFYYGFVGGSLVWQILYLILATDPIRYRPMMMPAFLVKLLDFFSITWLFVTQRADTGIILGAGSDLIFSVLFIVAWWITRRDISQATAS